MTGFKEVFSHTGGSVAAYAAVLAAIGIGGAALAIDFGRMAVVRAQMQDRADAGAMAAAVYLDGKDGVRALAEDVARNAVRQFATIAADSELRVATVNFYSDYTPAPVAAATDAEARYVEVILQTKQVDFMFQPVLAMLGGDGGGASSERLDARAVAASDPFICAAPPLMMCDPAETDPTLDLTDPANVGRQFRLKEPQAGGGAWVPGNFGLLELPDGSGGASAIQAALAAVVPADCYTLDVSTAPGSKTNQVRNGMNARFDVTGAPDPAPNVINYRRDTVIIADPNLSVGDAVWDAATYWADMHNGDALPGDLAGATRYQVYLYELGEDFGRNANLTQYPPSDPLPGGYSLVEPAGADIPVAADDDDEDNPDFDGVPSQAAAANGSARRVVKITIIQCIAENVHGAGTYPTNGDYGEMFITETVKEPPDAAIYGELIGVLTPATSPDFHANVQLIE